MHQDGTQMAPEGPRMPQDGSRIRFFTCLPCDLFFHRTCFYVSAVVSMPRDGSQIRVLTCFLRNMCFHLWNPISQSVVRHYDENALGDVENM